MFAGTITALEDLVSWWDALTDVEQSDGTNIDRLVGSTEGVINQEWGAWKATVIRSGPGENKEDRDDTEGGGGGDAAKSTRTADSSAQLSRRSGSPSKSPFSP